jgi:hypothetical protein
MPEPRIFTLDEAERALPLVRRIVADLQTEYRAWQEAVSRFELAAAGSRGDSTEPVPMTELRAAVDLRAVRVERLLRELEQIGCELKDFEVGLVDFYALLEDRLVYLCWRIGEDRITSWHELDAGYSGRQPIDAALFPGTIP